MSKPIPSDATILVASDSVTDAMLVKKLLGGEFGNVFTSINPDKAAGDFDQQRPNVLVLAFDALEKSKHYYLGLFRLSSASHLQPHRTIILCNKDEVQRAYALCRDGLFDDYVLFWPMTLDAPRLPMSVRLALRELSVLKDDGPTAAEFAVQARRLSELEILLEQQTTQGGQHIENASHAMEHAELKVSAALDGLSRRLPNMVEAKSVDGIEQEIDRLKRDEIGQHFRTVTKSMQPITQWANQLKQECQPHLDSVRSLNTLAKRVRFTVLVVDDDEFQHKIVSKILEDENYHLMFAASGAEALSILRKVRPDLILMDVMMPGMDGMEVTKQVKSVPRLANIPIIMITGKSDKNVVTGSLKAGATSFVVKPFDRDTLLCKVAQVLH